MKNSFYLIIASLVLCSCASLHNKKNTSEKEYSIAYNIHENDTIHKNNYEVITMNMDGSNKKNITNNPDVAWTYYAYTNRLFIISDRDTCSRCFFLYETDINGAKIRRISNLMLEDSWMSGRKNGEELVVSGRIGKETRYQLFIVNTKTGAYKQLTNEPNAKFGDPCFSPDGTKIAFYYLKDKTNRANHEELFVMNDDGTDMTQLTHYPENNISAKDYGYRAGATKWHPTENFITYVSLQDGRHSIYAVTPDGKKQWKLIHNEHSEGYHDWSSDGKWLTFNKSDIKESQYHIVLMNWKTKEQKQLTDATYKTQLSPVFVQK
ncbi:MAG: PD40 domain-containing protein [Saprospiraceae bacterium]|nr:PD40 domain-containing protein [Saprospiraceae bacterium]MBK7738878.1 PD40 domain-containing protein [Saprospiraceae bacterium]